MLTKKYKLKIPTLPQKAERDTKRYIILNVITRELRRVITILSQYMRIQYALHCICIKSLSKHSYLAELDV